MTSVYKSGDRWAVNYRVNGNRKRKFFRRESDAGSFHRRLETTQSLSDFPHRRSGLAANRVTRRIVPMLLPNSSFVSTHYEPTLPDQGPDALQGRQSHEQCARFTHYWFRPFPVGRTE
ncbi:MAG TPA: hypothetical protein EYQ50_03955 [Verrucomicrobiales bacterium]|nr:hypothetical protein [Verrucomicrobiales bacterium]